MQRRIFLKSLPAAAVASSFMHFDIPSLFASSQNDDEKIVLEKFKYAAENNLKTLPTSEIVIEIGKTFLGVDYIAHTLENEGEERLVINLRGLDCVLFCENALALARCVKADTPTFDDFKKQIQLIRYRNGVIDRYPSRLHYFSDWIFDNEKKGIVKNVTESIGGVKLEKIINFMTTHVENYRQLKGNPEFMKVIADIEREINGRPFYYIPKESIEKHASKIRNGSIIAITTTIEGMDMAHTGIAIRQGEALHFMHAPITGSKVQITEKTLADYLAGNKKQTGIVVAEVL
jgi:hypothetical protein